MAEVSSTSGCGMVSVTMGDHCLVNRLPRVNVTVACCAVDAFVAKGEKLISQTRLALKTLIKVSISAPMVTRKSLAEQQDQDTA